MPIIKFSTADILRSKNLETGWYSFQVKTVLGPRPNEAKTGIVYEAILTLIDSTNPTLNSKELSTYFGFTNGKGYGMDFIAAAMGLTSDQMTDIDLDTDKILGAKLDAKVKVDVYEGRQNNKFEAFLFYKKAAGQGVPF